MVNFHASTHDDFELKNILIVANEISEVTKLKKKLSKELEMKDLGESKKILGMEIQRNRGRHK